MNAWPVRITIIGATVVALALCTWSTRDTRCAAASCVWRSSVAATSPVWTDPPTIPVARVGSARGGADAGATAFIRPAWLVALAVLAGFDALGVLLSQAVIAPANRTATFLAFIGDSVEVSEETPAESLVAHQTKLNSSSSHRQAAVSRPPAVFF